MNKLLGLYASILGLTATVGSIAVSSFGVQAHNPHAAPSEKAINHYNIVDLGVLVPQRCQGAEFINDQGQIIGWGHNPPNTLYNDESQLIGYQQPKTHVKSRFNGHVYLWHNGKRENLGIFEAYGLNNPGQIIGDSVADSTGQESSENSFCWRQGTLRFLPSLPGGGNETADGINDSGQVVGQERSAYRNLHAFLWQNGHMTDLGSYGGTKSILDGVCLNNQGQVVANTYTYTDIEHQSAAGFRRSFLWQNGQTADISQFVGQKATVSKINDNVEMIGELRLGPHIKHAAFWTHGKRYDLGTLGGEFSQASALNNAGQVVGVAATKSGKGHAFLYENRQMFDLKTLIPTHSDWVLMSANDINNKGQIIGDGIYHGHNCSFLLTPQ